MPPSEQAGDLAQWVKLYLENLGKSQDRLIENLSVNQNEIKQSVVRVHDRLDLFLGRDYIQRDDCEKYRAECMACVNDRVEKSRGVPLITAAAITLACSLISGIMTYYFTLAANAAAAR